MCIFNHNFKKYCEGVCVRVIALKVQIIGFPVSPLFCNFSHGLWPSYIKYSQKDAI